MHVLHAQSNRRAAAAVIAAIALTVTGCAADAEPTATASPSLAPAAGAAAPGAAGAADPGAEPGRVTPTPRAPGAGVENGLAPAPPAAPVPTLPAKPFTDAAADAEGVLVRITGWRSITTPAGAPGEIAGPGVALDITVRNTTGRPISLENVVADLRTGSAEDPLLRADREPTVPFTGMLAPGKSAQATYAFNADDAQRADVTLYLSLNSGTPTVVFRGNVQ